MFNSSGLESKICIFNQLPGEVVVAAPQTTLWELRVRNVFYPCSVDAGSEQANKRYTKWPWGRAQVSFQWETRDDSLMFFCLIRAGGTVRTHCGQWWLSEIRISTEGSWTSRRSHQGTPKDQGWPRGCSPPEGLSSEQRLFFSSGSQDPHAQFRRDSSSVQVNPPGEETPLSAGASAGGKFTTASKGAVRSPAWREFLPEKGPPTGVHWRRHGTPLRDSCLENPADTGARGLQSMGSQESDTT